MKRCVRPASQRLRVLAGCLSVLLVLVAVQGCGKKQPPAPQPGQPETKATDPTAKPKADAVVVKVNGSSIMESDLEKRTMKMITEQTGGNLSRFTAEDLERFKKMLRVQVIDVLIAEKLIDAEIKTAGIKVTDDDVKTAVNTQGAKMNPPLTFDQYKKLVVEHGDDFNDVMATLRVDLARQKLVESQLGGKGDVNEATAKAYYDANAKQFERPEQVHASHILIMPAASDPNSDPNKAKLAAKQKAEALLEKIKGGADFAALAKSDSNDGSAEKGGDLGWFARGDMEKTFEDAAFGLEPNKVSGLVETRYGYHIIKSTGHRAAGAVPFDEVKKDIMEGLSEQSKLQVLSGYFKSLREKAKIEYTSPSDIPTPEPALEAVPPAAATGTPKADANQPKAAVDANQVKSPADPNKK